MFIFCRKWLSLHSDGLLWRRGSVQKNKCSEGHFVSRGPGELAYRRLSLNPQMLLRSHSKLIFYACVSLWLQVLTECWPHTAALQSRFALMRWFIIYVGNFSCDLWVWYHVWESCISQRYYRKSACFFFLALYFNYLIFKNVICLVFFFFFLILEVR